MSSDGGSSDNSKSGASSDDQFELDNSSDDDEGHVDAAPGGGIAADMAAGVFGVAWALANADDENAWPDVHDFKAKPGPTDHARNATSPLEFFMLFFTVGVFQHIADETNRYAMHSFKPEHRKARQWKVRDWQWFRKFVGIVVLMGVHKLPERRHYWSNDDFFRVDIVKRAMSAQDFEQTLRYLHFANNDDFIAKGKPGFDKLFKVRPLLDRLLVLFGRMYVPNREMSFDEQMIAFKGRTSLKQYMPAKPIKRGIKVWALADAHNGYVYLFDIYTGKNDDKGVDTGLATRCVLKLAQFLRGTWRIIYTDNFFTSPDLADKLYKMGLYLTGTMRTNKKDWPKDVQVDAKAARGTSAFRVNGKMIAASWMDNKAVQMLSTCFGTACATIKRRVRGDNWNKHDFDCPIMICKYNKWMGGVDRNDQLREAYHTQLKTHKWYHPIFFFLLDTAIVNSFILYKLMGGKMTHLQYRVALGKQLLGLPIDLSPDADTDDGHDGDDESGEGGGHAGGAGAAMPARAAPGGHAHKRATPEKQLPRGTPAEKTRQAWEEQRRQGNHFLEEFENRWACDWCKQLGRKETKTYCRCITCVPSRPFCVNCHREYHSFEGDAMKRNK